MARTGHCVAAGHTADWEVVTATGGCVLKILREIWRQDDGQDVAEYSVMLAVVLVIVVGTVRMIGSNAGNIFSSVGSAIQ